MAILPILASQVAGITSVSHWCGPKSNFKRRLSGDQLVYWLKLTSILTCSAILFHLSAH
jgi:hypothetical protein